MTMIALIRYDHLESILLHGYFELRDFCKMEMACSKWRFYVLGKSEISKVSSQQINMSDFQSVYDFSDSHRRKLTLQKEQWFNRRKIFKLSNEVLLTGFDDNSCRIGIDTLVNRTDIVKFTISDSFKYIPCTDCHRPDYEQTYDEEVDLAGFINKLCRSQLKELCFNYVPHLGRGLDNYLKLKKLTTLKIINCCRVDVFGILRQCYHLQILHYITSEDSWEEYGSVSLEENRVTMEEIIDDTCEQLHDICLCQSTARSWNLDGWFIDKYYDKIKFTFFDEMWEYYEVYNEFPSL